MLSRLGNLITGFMISDESGNRFFPTAATDYWQGRAGIAYQQTDFSEFFTEFAHISLSGIVNKEWLCHSSEYEFPEIS